MLEQKCRNADNKRDLAEVRPIPVDAFDRPCLPSTEMWLVASCQPDFNPMNVAPGLNMKDLLQYVDLDPNNDPSFDAYLTILTTAWTNQRNLLNSTHHLLRNRVDLFLVACRQAGLVSPALLPKDERLTNNPTIVALIRTRHRLATVLTRTCQAFPQLAKEALEEGDAAKAMGPHLAAGMDFYDTINAIACYALIWLLPLELETSIGVHLDAGTFRARRADWRNLCDEIAEEFVGSGASTRRMAASGTEMEPRLPASNADKFARVLSVTKFSESWARANPVMPYLVFYNTLAKRLAFIHICVVRRVRSVAQAFPWAPGIMDALSTAEANMNSCLGIMGLLAVRGAQHHAVYVFFKTIAEADALDLTMLEQSQLREEAEGVGEGLELGEEEEAKLHRVLQLFR